MDVATVTGKYTYVLLFTHLPDGCFALTKLITLLSQRIFPKKVDIASRQLTLCTYLLGFSYGVYWRRASCQIRHIASAHAPEMPGTFSPPSRVSDPDMHHATWVTHVPWCVPGSLTSGGGEKVPGACTSRNVTYQVRGPLSATLQ